MTENEINITDMIKALQCIASQDADGDCYCDHFNAHLTCEQFGDNTRLDEKHMSCGGVLKDTQSCPYSQNTYGVCYEDGELWWLKDIVSVLEEIQQYRELGTVEEILKVFNNQRTIIATQHETTKQYRAIGTIEEFKALKEYKAKMEMQYLDDINNPLEPLKLSSALQSEIRKYNYRKEHKPQDISPLDYTIMYALKHCLEEQMAES